MQRPYRSILVALLLVGIGVGCSKKSQVTGQVFVITKSGENAKLALVGIHVVSEQQLVGIASNLQGEASTNKANLNLLLELERETEALVQMAPPAFASPLTQAAQAISRRKATETSKPSAEELLFRRLPPVQTQTDADGVFVVAASETDWLAARAQRREGSSSESFLWLMPLKGVRGKLLVSNDRLIQGEFDLLKVLSGVSRVPLALNPEPSLAAWVAQQRTDSKQALAQAKTAAARAEAEAQARAAEEKSLAEAKEKADKEKALAEAKAKEEAEEKEKQRVAAEEKAAAERALAEAKAKAEEEEQKRKRLITESEARIASKLRLGTPFTPGVRGQSGAVAVRWVPEGRFTMGNTSTAEDTLTNAPSHEVTLSRGFFIAETECTQGQWEAVMESAPSYFKGSDRPVERVNVDEAMEYCQKLTAKQRADGVLAEGWEWRLPTEAEWEYAARSGAKGILYGDLNAVAWYADNSSKETHAVKQKAPNAWGIFDMIGNVCEWTMDRYGDYPKEAVTDPTGPRYGDHTIFRGGSWFDATRLVNAACRRGVLPYYRDANIGFRPVLSAVR